MRRRRRRKHWLGPSIVAVVIAAAAAVFLAVFYIPEEHVEVVGNTRYENSEISQIALPRFIWHNSVLLKLFRKKIVPDEVPFVNAIEVEYVARDRVRLHVTENYPIGYIKQDGLQYYFDADGMVIERLDQERTASAVQTQPDAAGTAAEKTDSSVSENAEGIVFENTESSVSENNEISVSGNTESNVSANTESSIPAETETEQEDTDDTSETEPDITSDTEFRPAVTDVSPVTGLTAGRVALGEVIPVNDPAIFQTLLNLNKLVSKFEIPPDGIEIGSDLSITLHYGKASVALGQDVLLEEKMTRAAAILPQIRSLEGVLHLEYFSSDTVNIIFEQQKG